MNKIKIVLTFLVLMILPMAMAAEDFSEAKQLLSQKIPYNQVTNNQFEIIGDYFMELLVGNNHENMDDMMGGEGSENLRQIHINMGRNYYQEYMQTGTIQNKGMMGNNYGMMNSNYGNGMMGYQYNSNNGNWFLWPVYVAITAFIFGIVFWWTRRFFNTDKKRKK